MDKRVYIIILNWNNWQETVDCIESCQKLAYPHFVILIVDNGSTDDSEEILKREFPGIQLIQTGQNLGYSGGNNTGIRHALERGADYVWLLNNDTVVDPHCLAKMVQAAEEDEKIGIVGSKIFYHRPPDTLWYAGGDIDLAAGGLTRHIGQDEKDHGKYDRAGETGYITGCSLLARKEMIASIGPLEEKYFLYFEDADWSLRARQQGWRLFYQPEARLWHKEGAQSERSYANHFIYYFIRNRFFFVRRFAPQNMVRCHLLQVKTSLFFLKQALGRGPVPAWKTLRLVLAAYRDFFLENRMGARKDL